MSVLLLLHVGLVICLVNRRSRVRFLPNFSVENEISKKITFLMNTSSLYKILESFIKKIPFQVFRNSGPVGYIRRIAGGRNRAEYGGQIFIFFIYIIYFSYFKLIRLCSVSKLSLLTLITAV